MGTIPQIKIGFVLPVGIGMCGGMRGTLEIANRLHDRGHNVTLYLMGDLHPSVEEHLQIRCKRGKVRAIDSGTDALVATEWTTASVVKDTKVSGQKFYFIQQRESRMGGGEAAERTYEFPLIPITVCGWLGNMMRTRGHEVVHVIRPGFWHDLFWRVAREDYSPRVLMEGHYGLPWKGCEEGWKAVRAVRAEHWVLSLETTPKDADRAFVCPPQQSLRWIYSQCDVMLKPSRSEAFPMTPAEAMACGCVPVVCDIPGMDEYCIDGDNCLKVAAGDIDAMRDAMEAILNDADLRERLRAGGRRTVYSHRFDWDARIDEWESVLKPKSRKGKK